MREVTAAVVLGVLMAFAAFGLATACSPSTLPELARCKLEALRVLPRDPGMATVYDAVDAIERLNACHLSLTDGGVP